MLQTGPGQATSAEKQAPKPRRLRSATRAAPPRGLSAARPPGRRQIVDDHPSGTNPTQNERTLPLSTPIPLGSTGWLASLASFQPRPQSLFRVKSRVCKMGFSVRRVVGSDRVRHESLDGPGRRSGCIHGRTASGQWDESADIPTRVDAVGEPRYCTTSRAATPMMPTVTQTSLESGESDRPPGYLATTCRSEADVNSGCALMSAAVASERLRLPRPWWRGHGLSCCSRISVAPGPGRRSDFASYSGTRDG